jgi:broad specificity phosphatase PhoE
MGRLTQLLNEKPADRLRLVLVHHARDSGAHGTDTTTVRRELTALGLLQAKRLAERLAAVAFDHVYTSGSIRAVQTCEELRRARPATPYTVCKDLREIRSFCWVEGLRLDEKTTAKMHAERTTVHHFMELILRQHQPGQRLLVVAHANVIRYLLVAARFGAYDPGLPLRPPGDDDDAPPAPATSTVITMNNSSISVMDVRPGQAPVNRLINYLRHLPADERS